jgi:CDP-paratose 2-epimerase
MKVIVTGGCGLIGYHAAKMYHAAGDEVVVMDNLERSALLGHDKDVSLERLSLNKRSLEAMGILVKTDDITSKPLWKAASLRGADVIIHMAGQCGVPTSIANPRRDWEVNANGTLNVLEHAREHGSVVVFASTNKVYPIHGDETFTKTNDRWNFSHSVWAKYGFPVLDGMTGARTPYGNSKMAADLMCQEWAHTYGVRTGVFRMSCIYGDSQMGFEEQGWAVWFIIAALKGWPITIFGDGCQVRDMLYVGDAVHAYSSFVRSSLAHGVWNLGGGVAQTVTLGSFLNEIEALTGKRSPVTYADWRPLDQKAYVTDLTKIQKDLNWTPTVGVAEGIVLARDWVADNLEVF